jgi:hypothetical protein
VRLPACIRNPTRLALYYSDLSLATMLGNTFQILCASVSSKNTTQILGFSGGDNLGFFQLLKITFREVCRDHLNLSEPKRGSSPRPPPRYYGAICHPTRTANAVKVMGDRYL